MNVVVVTWDGGSNRQPFEVLSGELLGLGHSVLVVSNEVHRSTFEPIGAAFQPLPVGDKLDGQRNISDAQDMERVIDIWLAPAIASELRRRLESDRPDVVVVDVTMLSAIAACEAVAVPLILLHHTLPGAFWGGPRSARFQTFIEPANRVRSQMGLRPAFSYGELIGHASSHMAATSAALDIPMQWPVPMHFVGPLQPTSPVGQIGDLPDDRFVLVSFSTTWQRQLDILQRVIDGLAPIERPVLVTTGPSCDPDELVPAANTTVVAELPHHVILDRVDLAITHAGHGTVMSALAAGVPLVCMPMGRDQHDVSARVAAVGAGVVLGVDSTSQDILSAAQRVLDDPAFSRAAVEMARKIHADTGVEGAIEILERAAMAHRPSAEPSGASTGSAEAGVPAKGRRGRANC